nr:unnamed protein product [Callosobruchus analis]
MKVLSNDSMRLNRLQKHLKQQRPNLVLKTKEFFSSKAESFKWMRLYKSIILGEHAEQKIKSVSLSNNTYRNLHQQVLD